MSKKNSSVNLKDLSNIFTNFKSKLNKLNKKSYVVAVSGGPDSLALVALTKFYSNEIKSKFYYVLINHNIRKNSEQEAREVKSLLKKYHINLKIISNKKKITKNIQGQARNIRYDLLSKYCKSKKIKIVLTAHNLEDQVETFFIRLSRGSGLTGLSAMKTLTKLDNNVELFRPLLDVKKKFLIKISKNEFGKYIKDPSNLDQKYLRTKIRSLKKTLEKNGIEYTQIIKSINNLASSKATLDEYYNNIFKEMIKKGRNKIFINLSKFNKQSNEIKIAILNQSIKRLKKNYYNPRAKKVENLIKNLKRRKFKKATLGGCLFVRKEDQLCLKLEKS
jgi:tRNA(Ile)-lysidine synthase